MNHADRTSYIFYLIDIYETEESVKSEHCTKKDIA